MFGFGKRNKGGQEPEDMDPSWTEGEKKAFREAELRIAEARRSQATRLDLSYFGLKMVPESLGQLSSLQVLHLSHNQLGNLPESLGQLSSLQVLSLSGNQLGNLPESLGQLSSLQVLHLSDNQLGNLPESLGQLSSLQVLDLRGNQLESVPESLGQLGSLQVLDLRGNQLGSLPESLGQLGSLRVLDLHNNQLESVPESLGQLRSLEEFSLSNTDLDNLPSQLQQLKSLQRLFLHENPKLGLPSDLLGPTWEDVLFGEAKPADPQAILTYYFESQNDAGRPLHEVKLLIVGRGGAGKSSIRDQLMGRPFDANRQETPGIDIDSISMDVTWDGESEANEITVHLWDFAGQEITHATHQFFLTPRSVYVLVLEGRHDTQKRDAEYWLKLVDGFSEGAPVIILLNKYETGPFEVDRISLQEAFPQILAFVETDCATGLGMEELGQQVCNAIQSLEESVTRPFPKAWWDVKMHFSQWDSEEMPDYLPFETFRGLCQQNQLEEDSHEILAQILCQLGIIQYYGNDPRLSNTTVLNPDWLTNSIYTLLRCKEKSGSDGVFTLTEAQDALDGLELGMLQFVIQLMRQFELCFSVGEEGDTWLAPDLLPQYPSQIPGDWKLGPDLVRLRYQYTGFPQGLLPRFITRTHSMSRETPRWREGVVLKRGDAMTRVRAEPDKDRIEIFVRGSELAKRDLSILVQAHLDDINHSFRHFEPKLLKAVGEGPEDYVHVSALEQDELNGRSSAFSAAEKGRQEVSPTEELDEIRAPGQRVAERKLGEKPKLPKIFASYSHKNEQRMAEFRQNLELLERYGVAEFWFAREIREGDNWHEKIIPELEEADYMVCLVSNHFLISDYIESVELKRALERVEEGSMKRIFYVILDNCQWELHPRIQETHVLKPGGMSLVDYAGQGRNDFEQAFHEVGRIISEVIEKDKEDDDRAMA